MRIDKFIAHSTAFSRREVKYLIKAKRILINTELAKKIDQTVLPTDTVSLDDQHLPWPGPRYFMLNKPVGYVCATKDGTNPTVIELLAEVNEDKLHIAGRLDIDTTGLVLITDDGKWSHRVMSPNHEHTKRYRVQTSEPIDEALISQFAAGIQLKNEKQKTKPATLEIISATEAILTISEGKYHQVKRMFGAVGNHVAELHREAVGNIELDAELEPGQYRALTALEIECF